MKTVAQIIEDTITTLPELQEALLLAIQLEFSTLPPYLVAEWSINSDNNGDPDGVAGIVHGVLLQEMLHFGLACNMYTATGGSLAGKIATPGFVPTYPTDAATGLPGGVHPGLSVSLSALNSQALQIFMSIEYPEGAPVVPPPSGFGPFPAPNPPAIGDFYQTIAFGFVNVFLPNPANPTSPTVPWPNNPSKNQVQYPTAGNPWLFAINSVGDALNAIAEITAQGEGTNTSPDEGTFDPNNLAHYYSFAEIYYGESIIPVGNGFEYSGTQKIKMPATYTINPNPGAPGQQQFINDFTALVQKLQSCWVGGGSLGMAIGQMASLHDNDAIPLIQAGYVPEFIFQLPSNPKSE